VHIAVIACTKAKLRHEARAVGVYSASPLFRKSVDQAVADGLRILVLSTKYGLIDGDVIIAPYEPTFEATSPADRQACDQLVDSQVAHRCQEAAMRELVFFAGIVYRVSVKAMWERRGVRTSVDSRWKAICDGVFRS
jgi:hypothetical protein